MGDVADEAAQQSVEYARKKVERARNFSTMPGKTKLALGELKQALSFATRGNADDALLAEIKEMQELIAAGAENVDKNKSGGGKGNAPASKAASKPPTATKPSTTPFCDEAFSRPDVMLKVLQFCSWEQRVQMMDITRPLHEAMTLSDHHYKWMCERLAEEDKLYVPEELCGADSWRALFLDLWPKRKMFHEPPPQPVESDAARNIRLFREGRFEEMSEMTEEEETAVAAFAAAEKAVVPEYKFQIQVCARMRPSPPGTTDSSKTTKEDAKAVSMVLPLHQRLKLIMQDNKCSASEARKILWKGQVGSGVDPYANSRLPETEQELQEVIDAREAENAARDEGDGKPAAGKDIQASVLSVEAGRRGSVLMVAPGAGLREFKFDSVVGERGNQSEVYGGSVRRLVADFVNGNNACVLAYGQTGSGKTHTMFGPDAKTGSAVVFPDMDKSGIVPRACSEVMRVVKQRSEQGIEVKLRVSYVEVYGDSVTDLLNDGAGVGMWQGVAHRALFTGGCSVAVPDAEALEKLLLDADSCKRRAATAMNERSSRAHALLLLDLLQVDKDTGAEVTSHMCFADLGGSEQVLKSEVAEMYLRQAGFMQKETRMQEAVNINLGLLSLKACIQALVEKTYVPYQNSRLTMLLSSALGGNCRTCVVVTGSSEKQHAIETMQSMRFGESCTLVTRDTSGDNMAAVTRAIRQIDAEIEVVEEAIRAKERWETIRIVREDELHQEGEATASSEVVVKSVLVGAEVEREHLELLLSRRRILSGN